jgi:hypothetical protein
MSWGDVQAYFSSLIICEIDLSKDKREKAAEPIKVVEKAAEPIKVEEKVI